MTEELKTENFSSALESAQDYEKKLTRLSAQVIFHMVTSTLSITKERIRIRLLVLHGISYWIFILFKQRAFVIPA